jgi:glycine cleavage system H protein
MEYLELKVDKWTFKVPKGLFYNENDFWAKIDGKTATVGITSYLQSQLSDIIFVSLPQVGAKIEQFGEAGSFESVKAALDVISPVSGSVVEVNHELENTPDLANSDPYGKGWFLKIELLDLESDKENLIDAEAYFEVMKRKVQKEHEKLKSAKAKDADVRS